MTVVIDRGWIVRHDDLPTLIRGDDHLTLTCDRQPNGFRHDGAGGPAVELAAYPVGSAATERANGDWCMADHPDRAWPGGRPSALI